MPQIIPGAGGEGTESESSVIYLAFENITAKDQRGINKQVWSQLAVKITLTPPASMQPAMQADTAKDGDLGIKPSDTPTPGAA